MSSSMNALTLSSALGSNLKSLKQASASAQNIYSCDERREDKDEQQLIDLGQDHQERATTEPPTGTTLSVAQPNQESLLEAASTPVLAGRDRSSTSSTVDLKTLEMMRGGFSVPNLANTESASSDRTDGQLSTSSQRSYTPQPSPSPSMSHKNLKGLRNIFGKIKRSNSGTLDDLDPLDGAGNGEFKRGGVRATAGPRLGWTNSEFRKPDKPFREWNLDTLCLWFEQMGLGMYEEELRKWLKVGGAAELAAASPVDIEKELSLRNALHRKKIVLAVADVAESEEEDGLLKCAGKLDTAWILRWLEDIGLPQHKDSFTAARMDGRMLHKLTMDDLAHLHVSSCLHVASIRRGIQLMREQKWNPNCFIQRAPTDGTPGETKDNVRLWSCSRVMDWLRLLDLSEYAPNLREERAIPPSKTLLRRHLATHFKELLGREIIQVKRDAENTLGFQPLTLAAKIKTPKKSQFSLKRKKSSKGLTGDEWSDYVCPMGDSGQDHLPPHLQTPANSSQSQSNNAALAMTKSPYSTYHPDSSISSTSSSSTAMTSGPASEARLISATGGGGGSSSSSPVPSSLMSSGKKDNTGIGGAANFIASFSPVKDVYKSVSTSSNYSSSSSLVSTASSARPQSQQSQQSSQNQGSATTQQQVQAQPGKVDASGAPVQRSASFNATCTVPLSISKTTQVKNSASFSNCSLLTKVAKKSGLTASLTANSLLKFSSSSSANSLLALKQQQQANGITISSNITEALAMAGQNPSACLRNSPSASSSTSLASSTTSTITAAAATAAAAASSAASTPNSPAATGTGPVAALSLAQFSKNNIVDYYV
ncbi:hypothetical protein pipiens_001997 [Culex pipiens pipiens]|uniref:SAM domain-containing protein n=1 Tax=Culex pipiens pipiens TaxID=38569 RepID=A0ABD1DN71_CULPP